MKVKSYQTAILRKLPSKPARFLNELGLLKGKMLDYGCGYGLDAMLFHMDRFDPAFFPKRKFKGKYDIIVCIYVLNVVSTKEQNKIIINVKKLLRKGGKAYFAVRRDLKIKTKTQRIVKLNLSKLVENSSFCIYKLNQ